MNIKAKKILILIIISALLNSSGFSMPFMLVYGLESVDNVNEQVSEPQPQSIDYNNLVDIEEIIINNTEAYADENGLVLPEVSLTLVNSTDYTVTSLATCVNDYGANILEYGLVYSYDYEYPTFAKNQGSIKIGEGSFESFNYDLETEKSVFVRAYTIYDENKVYYSNQIQNYNSGDQELLKVSKLGAYNFSEPGNQGQVIHKDSGDSLDKLAVGFISIAGLIEINMNVETLPEESAYLVLKGNFGGFADLKLNNNSLGYVNVNVLSEYYAFKVPLELLVKGNNKIELWVYALGWGYVDSATLIFDGGDQSKGHVQDIKFEDWSSRFNSKPHLHAIPIAESCPGRYYVDIYAKAVLEDINGDEDTRLVGSVGEAGFNHFTSDHFALLNTSVDRQSYDYRFQIKDDHSYGHEEGNWQAYSIIVDGKKPLTVTHRDFYYENNVGPRNFSINFTQDINDYTNQPVTLRADVDDLFGKPFGYLEDPSGNKIYDYSTYYTVTENGTYNFKTVEPDGRETVIAHRVTNIDKEPPAISLIGDNTITIIEEEGYADLGVIMTDDLSGLISYEPTIDYGGLDTNNPAPGNYTITYQATDRAGNTSTLTRTVIVKNKPLTMLTDAVTKSEDLTQAIFQGNIKYAGDEALKEKGFVWALTKNPTIENNDGIQSFANGLDSKEVYEKRILISQLLPGATYSVRSYAITNSNKVVYGNNQTFTADDKEYGVINLGQTAYDINKGDSVSFTINRTNGGDGDIKVFYRTIDVSALNGLHYVGKSGSITFPEGETGAKSIDINTLNYNTYQKVSRKFYFEIFKVEGGASIGNNKTATIVFSNDISSIASISNNTWREIWSTSTNYQSESNTTWYAPSGDLPLGLNYNYWREYANSFQARGYGDINTNSSDVRFGLQGYINNAWQTLGYRYFTSSDDWEYTSVSGSNAVNATRLRLKMDVEKAGGRWDDGGVHKPKVQLKISDTTKPRIIGYSVPLGNYLEGQNIYIAVKFSEIVTGTNLFNTNLNLKLYDENNQAIIKQAKYLAGNNTDTLVYQYTVEEGVSADLLEYGEGGFINKENIIDLVGNTFTDSVSGIIMNNVKIASVDHGISFEPNGGDIATSHSVVVYVSGDGIEQDSIAKEYLWCDVPEMQFTGFKPFNNGDILTVDGATGTYYLHIRTVDNFGNKTYKVSSGYQLNNVQPTFMLEPSTKEWTNNNITINIKNIPDNANVITKKYAEGLYAVESFPTEGSPVIEGDSFAVSENSVYSVFIETSMGMKYVSSISINNIDKVMPVITIGKENTSPEGTSSNALPNGSDGQPIYKAVTTATVSSVGQSGLYSLEYQWTNSASRPTGWTSFNSGDILQKSTNGTWYLHVKAITVSGQEAYLCSNPFIVNNEGPTITVVAARELTEWTSEPLPLVVTAEKASGLNRIILPDGSLRYDNDTYDTNTTEGVIETEYIVSSNKYYIFRAVDNAGNTSEASFNVNRIDSDPPNIIISKSEENWTSNDIELTITLNDLTSPTYNEDGVVISYGGAGGIKVKGLGAKVYTDYSDPITYTIEENGVYQITATDSLGNVVTRDINISNIDKNPPFVETTNTDFSAKSEAISTTLIFKDLEMGLVRDKKFKITNNTEMPIDYDIYDGKVINLTEAGTYYIHYFATDGAGNSVKGYFGPYTLDSTVPSISFTPQSLGAQKSHSTLISVNYNGLVIDEEIKYQWTNSIDTPYVNWNNTIANNGSITKSDVNGEYFLHVMVSAGGAKYYGVCSFVFDNQAPSVVLKGENPYLMNYGEIYVENGVKYSDNIDLWPFYTAPNASLVQNEVPGFYELDYAVTDKSGNSTIVTREIIVLDNVAPIAEDFNITVAEDNQYAFNSDVFNDHYDDITEMKAVIIKSLPSNGELKLNNIAVKINDIVPTNRLGELTYMPNQDFFGNDDFDYQVVDSAYLYNSEFAAYEGNFSNTQKVILNISSVNDIPVVNDDIFETNEDTPITDTALMGNNDSDIEGLLTVIGVTQPSNGSAQLNANGTITYTPELNFNGNDSFTYTVEDTDGVQATANITVKVNSVNDVPLAPTEINVSNSQYQGGQNITLNWSGASDVDGDSLIYIVDYFNGTSWVNIAENIELSSYSFALPYDDINSAKVRVFAHDRKIKSEDYCESDAFIVDSTAPEAPGLSMTSSEWTSGDITVLFNSGSDALSGRNRYEYSKSYSADNISWSEWSAWQADTDVTLTNDGLHKIKARSIDNVGNISNIFASGVYKIDKTMPETFIVEAEALSQSSLKIFGVTSDNETVIANSGLADMPFRYAEYLNNQYMYTEYDNLGYHIFNGYLANEQHVFQMKVKDVAGNEQTSTNAISIYTLASNPLSTELVAWDHNSFVISFIESSNVANPTYRIWLTKQFDTAVVGAKTSYATKQDTYTFDNLTEDTLYDVWIQTRNGDNIENEPVKYGTYKTNKKPELVINNNSKNLYYKAGEIVAITGTVLDKDNEEITITGSINGVQKSVTISSTNILQNWTLSWNLAEVLISNGNYKGLAIVATDERGSTIDSSWNESVMVAYAGDLFIDTTSPDPASVIGTNYNENWSNRLSETITINADDALSGLGDIQYSLTGAENRDYTSIENNGTVTVAAEGITTVNVKAYDKSGNVSNTSSYKVRLDRTNPNAKPSNYTGVFVNSASKDTVDWTKNDYEIDVTYQDERGIDEVFYVISGSAETPASYGVAKADLYDGIPNDGNYTLTTTSTIDITENGTHYLHYKVIDLAGNTYTGCSGPYKLDKTMPTISFTYDGFESGIRKTHAIVVNVADQAQLSGVLKSEYIWTQSSIKPSDNANFTVFQSGNTINKSNVNGEWYLWIRATDLAGNVYYQCSDTNTVLEGNQPFVFDNTSPTIDTAIENGGLTTNAVLTFKGKAVDLPSENSIGLDYYKYQYSTNSKQPDFNNLEQNPFETFTNYLRFDGSAFGNLSALIASIRNKDISLAFEFKTSNIVNNDMVLFSTEQFSIGINGKTGAIYVAINGEKEYFSGGFNDGLIHKLTVTLNQEEQLNIFMDGRLVANYDFLEDIAWNSVLTAYVGKPVSEDAIGFVGSIYRMKVLTRQASLEEGKTFSFNKNSLIADYIICQSDSTGNENTVYDRSEYNNNMIITGTSWTGEYKRMPIMSFNGMANYVNLDYMANTIKSQNQISILIRFKNNSNTLHGEDVLFSMQDNTTASNVINIEIKEQGFISINDGSNYSTNKVVNDGMKHEVILTFNEDLNLGVIYIDGQRAKIFASTKSLTAVDLISIGQAYTDVNNGLGSNSANFFDGEIYNLSVFNRVITETEALSSNVDYSSGLIANYCFSQNGINMTNKKLINTVLVKN